VRIGSFGGNGLLDRPAAEARALVLLPTETDLPVGQRRFRYCPSPEAGNDEALLGIIGDDIMKFGAGALHIPASGHHPTVAGLADPECLEKQVNVAAWWLVY